MIRLFLSSNFKIEIYYVDRVIEGLGFHAVVTGKVTAEGPFPFGAVMTDLSSDAICNMLLN